MVGNENILKVDPQTINAEFGEWPHVCAVLRKETLGSKDGEPLLIYQCGSSLLDEGVLLTGAHCVHKYKPSDLVIRCGEYNTQIEDTHPFQEKEVDTIQIHPEFESETHKYNFAILFMKEEFELADHISPICLPPPCVEYPEQNCVANGWGKDKFGSDGRFSTILKEVAYPVVDNKQCEAALRKTRLGEFFELHDTFMCAGGIKGVDTCKGDGGSPLSCRILGTDRWLQAGIVSWGIGCGEDGIPAVYARVNRVSCWIDYEVTNQKKRTESFSGSSYFGYNAADCSGVTPACTA